MKLEDEIVETVLETANENIKNRNGETYIDIPEEEKEKLIKMIWSMLDDDFTVEERGLEL